MNEDTNECMVYGTVANNDQESVQSQSLNKRPVFKISGFNRINLMNSSAQRQIEPNVQNKSTLSSIKQENLSKSIVLHHNKMNPLLNTVGRYNDHLLI